MSKNIEQLISSKISGDISRGRYEKIAEDEQSITFEVHTVQTIMGHRDRDTEVVVIQKSELGEF